MTPPYTDHHVHLLATAAARLSVDVSPARSIGQLARLVRASSGRGAGRWIRAWGYEEWALAERRHPERDDLDRIEPDRPMVLHHRTGHACAMNSAALAAVGATDHPSGVLFDRHDLLAKVPRLAPVALERAAAEVSAEWWAAGTGAFTDATHTNGPEELARLSAWRASGALKQEVTVMVALQHAAAVGPFGARVGDVRVGPVKIMPPVGGGADRMREDVEAAHRLGFPVAVHVMDFDGLEATLDAFEGSPPPPGTFDRIEHNALCLPEQVARIAACRAAVVVNPSFLLHRRPKYELEVPAVERPWLIRVGSLVRAGVPVRAGSDSPVAPGRPAEMIAGAVRHPFAPGESVPAPVAEGLLRGWDQ
jgi:predicted amidohydrolase YtcJ